MGKKRKQATIQYYLSDNNLDLSSDEVSGAEAADYAEHLFRNLSAIEICNLSHKNMKDKDIKSLLPYFHKTLVFIDLSFNRITAKGAGQIAACIDNISSLMHLDVSNNNIGSAGANAIIRILPTLNNLTFLNFRSNHIDFDNVLFQDINCKSLNTLRLSYNDIRNKGIRNLSSFISNCSSLELLDLSHMNIESTDIELICIMIENLPSMHTLNLRGNQINHDGAKHIAKYLESNKTLKTLNIKNSKMHVDDVLLIQKALDINFTITKIIFHNTEFDPFTKRNLAIESDIQKFIIFFSEPCSPYNIDATKYHDPNFLCSNSCKLIINNLIFFLIYSMNEKVKQSPELSYDITKLNDCPDDILIHALIQEMLKYPLQLKHVFIASATASTRPLECKIMLEDYDTIVSWKEDDGPEDNIDIFHFLQNDLLISHLKLWENKDFQSALLGFEHYKYLLCQDDIARDIIWNLCKTTKSDIDALSTSFNNAILRFKTPTPIESEIIGLDGNSANEALDFACDLC